MLKLGLIENKFGQDVSEGNTIVKGEPKIKRAIWEPKIAKTQSEWTGSHKVPEIPLLILRDLWELT